MRFRLRYQHHDLALGDGEFVVGRSAGCQLSLDDPLVSRRHAMLVVTKDAVTVEDLGGATAASWKGEGTLAKRGSRGTMPKIAAVPETSVRNEPSEPPTPLKEDLTGRTEGDSSTVRRVTAFKLLGGVAEKALAMGRADEAERLLAGPLADLVEASRNGRPVPPWLGNVAARLAAKLATTTAKGAWADYVIELYQSQGRPCAAPVVDELNNAFRKVNAIDLVRLRAYLAELREKQAT